MTLGLEFPLVDPNSAGEFRISLAAAIGPHYNGSIALAANNYSDNLNFRKFSLMGHSAINKEALGSTDIIRVPLGSINEKSNGWSLLGGEQSDLETLRNTFTLLEKSSAKAIIFDFSDYSGSLSISQEIRRGIYSLKSKGKRIAAYSNNYRPAIIFAASAADRVILQPSAFVDFKGLSTDVLYLKGFLAWAGIKIEMVRHGSYKSATEPYTLDSMSNEARENLQGILGGWWSIVRDTVAYSRNILPEILDSIASNPKVTATAAKNNGLADATLYLEEVPKYVSKVLLERKMKMHIQRIGI